MKAILSDVVSDIDILKELTRKRNTYYFVGKGRMLTERSNVHRQQIGVKFTSALNVATFDENKDLLRQGIGGSGPPRKFFEEQDAAYFADLWTGIAVNVDAGRC